MKILAFTDIHGNLRDASRIISIAKKENVDFIVCAGDISFFESDLKEMLIRFKEAKKPLIIIPGNHESEEYLERLCKSYSFCVYIHKRTFSLGEFVFFGFGGGGFASRYKELEELTKNFNKNLKDGQKVIFVTHAPVYGTKTDYLDLVGHVGSKSARDFISEVKPILVLCGHLHENEGVVDHIAKTLLINPGRKGKIIEL